MFTTKKTKPPCCDVLGMAPPGNIHERISHNSALLHELIRNDNNLLIKIVRRELRQCRNVNGLLWRNKTGTRAFSIKCELTARDCGHMVIRRGPPEMHQVVDLPGPSRFFTIRTQCDEDCACAPLGGADPRPANATTL